MICYVYRKYIDMFDLFNSCSKGAEGLATESLSDAEQVVRCSFGRRMQRELARSLRNLSFS